MSNPLTERERAQAGQPFWKPTRQDRLRVARKAARGEKARKVDVRKACVNRDGYCRLLGIGPWDCHGPSEWAHLEHKRRGKTVNQAPEIRHTTEASAMFCRRHHEAYDAHRLRIQLLTPAGANGPLGYDFDGAVYLEEQGMPRVW